MYSYPGELILDPFAGSGQTMRVAKYLGRRCVGYEVVEKYAALAMRRLDEPPALRPEQLVAVFDKVGLDEPAASARQPRRRRSPGALRGRRSRT
jgi:site-specific DNA-methyltransferase (adenine-specific)